MTGIDQGGTVGGSFDLLVIGSGVAGLSAAVAAANRHGLRVAVVTKAELADGTTRWAQGGVAAALADAGDSTELHFADTLAAGGDLCDPAATRVLVDEGPRRVRDLMEIGAVFDRTDDGRLAFAREGGHSVSRVIHAGGSATGAEVERALDAATRRAEIVVYENWFVFELVTAGGRCVGVRALGPDGSTGTFGATNVLLASGGAGQLFAVTTNPLEATGDGTAMALRAGVAVADVEFMQFHPTALHVSAMPRPLLTEALRGHGALLRGPDGERFVDELAPRDVVSRAETAVMIETHNDHVWLDATGLDDFAGRFANITAALAAVGLDPARDWLPVAPAAHYLSGGVVTDLSGAASLAGLWAAGEAACTGVHGANRLASNSLLEGLVFGPRVVEAIVAGQEGPRATGAMRALLESAAATGSDTEIIGARWVSDPDPDPRPDAGSDPGSGPDADSGSSPAGLDVLRAEVQRVMTFEAGVLRDAESLAHADAVLATTAARSGRARSLEARSPEGRSPKARTPKEWELANLCTVGRALVGAARARAESRGAHTRTDHPDRDPTQRHRLIQPHPSTTGT